MGIFLKLFIILMTITWSRSFPLHLNTIYTTTTCMKSTRIFSVDTTGNYNIDEAQSLTTPIKLPRLKVRQHVNPLSSKFLEPAQLESNWVEKSFVNPMQPLIVDIGCSRGSWVMYSGIENQNINFLGLEIRRPVVEFALSRKYLRNLSNIHYIATNVNVDLNRLLGDIHRRNIFIKAITIQFPDPHFKRKHKKRRVLDSHVVNTIAEFLPHDSHVFVQSDVKDVAYDMSGTLKASPYFAAVDGYDINKLDSNKSPFSIQTEREIATLNKNLPVYRMFFQRNNIAYEPSITNNLVELQ